MVREVNPAQTNRASAYALWMNAPNPMVTFFKTLDATHLVRVSRRRKLKFQMLMDYCIGEYGVCIDDIGGGSFRYLIAGEYTGGEVPEGMVLLTLQLFLKLPRRHFWVRGPGRGMANLLAMLSGRSAERGNASNSCSGNNRTIVL